MLQVFHFRDSFLLLHDKSAFFVVSGFKDLDGRPIRIRLLDVTSLNPDLALLGHRLDDNGLMDNWRGLLHHDRLLDDNRRLDDRLLDENRLLNDRLLNDDSFRLGQGIDQRRADNRAADDARRRDHIATARTMMMAWRRRRPRSGKGIGKCRACNQQDYCFHDDDFLSVC